MRKDQGYIGTIPCKFLKRNNQLRAEMPLYDISTRKKIEIVKRCHQIFPDPRTFNEILIDILPRKSLGYTDMSFDNVGFSAMKSKGHSKISLDDLSERQNQGYSSIVMSSGEASHSEMLHGTNEITSNQLPVEQGEHCKDFQ